MDGARHFIGPSNIIAVRQAGSPTFLWVLLTGSNTLHLTPSCKGNHGSHDGVDIKDHPITPFPHHVQSSLGQFVTFVLNVPLTRVIVSSVYLCVKTLKKDLDPLISYHTSSTSTQPTAESFMMVVEEIHRQIHPKPNCQIQLPAGPTTTEEITGLPYPSPTSPGKAIKAWEAHSLLLTKGLEEAPSPYKWVFVVRFRTDQSRLIMLELQDTNDNRHCKLHNQNTNPGSWDSVNSRATSCRALDKSLFEANHWLDWNTPMVLSCTSNYVTPGEVHFQSTGYYLN
ncbi:hypothetical protein J6590_075085 [Homalodisca vitripennis]|nr:hypothetical protein J6590_075085 [Homalodisca vitripennis]